MRDDAAAAAAFYTRGEGSEEEEVGMVIASPRRSPLTLLHTPDFFARPPARC